MFWGWWRGGFILGISLYCWWMMDVFHVCGMMYGVWSLTCVF